MADFEVVHNKRAKADIWRHFGLKKRKSDSVIEEGIAICRQCEATIKCTGGGTSNMTTHMRRHHPDVKTDVQKLFNSPPPSPVHSSSSAPTTPLKSHQPTIITSFVSQSKYPPSSPKAKDITNKIALWIIHDMMPYSVVDSPYFRDVLEALDPRYQVPSRKQFSEITVPSLYTNVKQKVKKSLKDAEQVTNSPEHFSFISWRKG